MKKRKGSLVDVLSSLIVILCLTIIMLAYLYTIQAADMKLQIDQLARKYILEMETTGYLSEAEETRLKQELTQLQVEEIDLTGTTFSQAGYGNPVYLQIQCSIPSQSIHTEGGNLFTFFTEEKSFQVKVIKMSTAKN